jgi:hypothetical protein
LGWQSYDTQFRLRLSANPASELLNFTVINQELWLLCIGPSNLFNLSGDKKCYDFNLRSCTCVVWSYRHCCLNCSGNHSAQACWRPGGTGVVQRPRGVKSTFSQLRQPYREYCLGNFSDLDCQPSLGTNRHCIENQMCVCHLGCSLLM